MQAQNGNASAAVRTGGGVLCGFILQADSAAATLALDDSTDGSGTVLGSVACNAGESAVVTGIQVPFSDGLYCALTGTGAQFTAYIK